MGHRDLESQQKSINLCCSESHILKKEPSSLYGKKDDMCLILSSHNKLHDKTPPVHV